MDALSDPYEWYRQQLISYTSQQALNDKQATTQQRPVSDYEARQFQLMLQERLSQGPNTTQSTRTATMSDLPINPSLESKHEYFSQANQAKLGQALEADPEAKALFASLAAQKNPNDAIVQQLVGQLKGYFEGGQVQGSILLAGQEAIKGQGGDQSIVGQGKLPVGEDGKPLPTSPEALLGTLGGKEGGATMDKLQSNAALQQLSTYFGPGNEAKLDALLAQNPEAKALFDQLVQQRQPNPEAVQQLVAQLKSAETPIPAELNDKLVQWGQQLSPQLRAIISELAPAQLAQLANLTPQELTHLEKGGAEKLLAKLGINPETLNQLSTLKGDDVTRLGELRELIQQFARSTSPPTGPQGVVPQGTLGDAILAALNAPAAQEAAAENAVRTASAEARVAQIGNLVAERILVTNPELSQKQEVLIVLKQDVLPGTQIKLSREGNVLNIAFMVRSEDTSNFIHQNVGQLRDVLRDRLGETVNVAVKSEQGEREENEGRSRNRRSVFDEMGDDESVS